MRSPEGKNWERGISRASEIASTVLCLLVGWIAIAYVAVKLVLDRATDLRNLVYLLLAGYVAFLIPRISKIALSKDGASVELEKKVDRLQGDSAIIKGVTEETQRNTTAIEKSISDQGQVLGFMTNVTLTTQARRRRLGVPGGVGQRNAAFRAPWSGDSNEQESGTQFPVTLLFNLASPDAVDIDDPCKNQFGKSAGSGRRLRASVEAASIKGWFNVTATVESTDPNRPLTEPVKLYLYPTFPNPVIKAAVDRGTGIAAAQFLAWGAFTIGCETDFVDGKAQTRLELDLSSDEVNAPSEFKASKNQDAAIDLKLA